MLVTFWVLKCDTSREGKPGQSKNIPTMSVTFWVLKCDTSREGKRWQLANIPRMSVTFWVLKCDTSREVKLQQPLNIPPMSFTSEVLRNSNPSICLIVRQSLNHRAVVVGRKSRNEASNTTRVISMPALSAHAGKVSSPSSSPCVSSMPQVVPVRVARRAS